MQSVLSFKASGAFSAVEDYLRYFSFRPIMKKRREINVMEIYFFNWKISNFWILSI